MISRGLASDVHTMARIVLHNALSWTFWESGPLKYLLQRLQCLFLIWILT